MPRQPDGTIRYADTHYRDTWVAMEKLVDQGLVKAIGLSNFNAKQIDDILNIAKHKPVVNQVQYCQQPCHCYFIETFVQIRHVMEQLKQKYL